MADGESQWQQVIPDSWRRQGVFVTGGSGFIGNYLISLLVAAGIPVRALARSEAARSKVAALGAEAIPGDLDDSHALRRGMHGAAIVFHCGGYLSDWDWEQAWRVNVLGTRNVLNAARRVGVPRVVYVSGIGVTLGDGPARDIDETRSRGRPVGVLCATRVRSEADVEAANGSGIETVIVRFPYVWGPGDTLRPLLLRMLRTGRFRWIGKGDQLISICHVDNAARGLVLAAVRGRAGAIYWIADDVVPLRTFFEAQLAVDGMTAPDRSIPRWLAIVLADTTSFIARRLGSTRPAVLTPTTVRFLSQQITVSTQRARSELGFEPLARWPDALSELRPLS